MRIAEQVTFGGSGKLDRAAALRGDDAALARLWSRQTTRILPLWRGKVLVREAGALSRAAFLGHDHPLAKGRASEALFLGLLGDRAYFAIELTEWEPQGLPDTMDAFLDPSRQRHPLVPDAEFAELRSILTRLDAAEAELAVAAKAVFAWHRSHRFCSTCGAPSRPAQAGWQRDCPACHAHHFPRTDPVVIMLITHGHDLLVGRSPGWPDGMYSLLAGFVEPGETIEAAVRREVAEETAVPVGRVGYLASQPWPFPTSLMIGCRGEALGRDIRLDPTELEDAFWISRSELADVMAGTSTRITPARPGAIAHFLIRNWLADRLT